MVTPTAMRSQMGIRDFAKAKHLVNYSGMLKATCLHWDLEMDWPMAMRSVNYSEMPKGKDSDSMMGIRWAIPRAMLMVKGSLPF